MKSLIRLELGEVDAVAGCLAGGVWWRRGVYDFEVRGICWGGIGEL